MFRFSFEKDAPLAAGKEERATADVTEDRALPRRLQEDETGEYRRNEQYFRAENEQSDSLKEAVAFVRGIFGYPPKRVWLDGQVYEPERSAG